MFRCWFAGTSYGLGKVWVRVVRGGAATAQTTAATAHTTWQVNWMAVYSHFALIPKPTKESDKKKMDKRKFRENRQRRLAAAAAALFCICLSLIDFNFKRFRQWVELTWNTSTDIRHAQLPIAQRYNGCVRRAMICFFFPSHGSLCSFSLLWQRQVGSKLSSRKQRNIFEKKKNTKNLIFHDAEMECFLNRLRVGADSNIKSTIIYGLKMRNVFGFLLCKSDD